MQNILKNNTNTLEKKLVIGLCITLLIFFGLYGYFVNATILNIVEREALEERAGELVAEVSVLEKKHGSLRSTITYEYARSLGFVSPQKQAFATQKRLVGALSLD